MSFAPAESASFERRLRVLETSVASLTTLPEVALHVIADGSMRLFDVSESAGEARGSRVLDEWCLRLGRDALAVSAVVPKRERSPRLLFVYVVSRLYKDGGHTRVLEDLVRALPDADHAVVWLSCEENVQTDDYAEILRVEPVPAIYRVRGALEPCVLEGVAILNALQPDAVVLLGHPHDPVALALMAHRPQSRRLVIHHADHSFALGRFVPGATHVSLTRRFSALAHERWGIATSYLPLTCADPFVRAAPGGGGELTTASSASARKFDLDGRPSYLDVLRERFTRREGKHVHFGWLEPAQTRRIADVLEQTEASERFTHIPFVESLSLAMLYAGVNLYIDSVPTAGAKSLIEAMAAGIAPCFSGHDAAFDGSTYRFDGAFSWRTARELGEYLAVADDDVIREAGARARVQYEREHSPAVFEATLRAILRDAQVDSQSAYQM